jgi:peroxiredoxin
VRRPISIFSILLAASVTLRGAAGDEPAHTGVAHIQAKHDRALIAELADYIKKYPNADDREQAYAALFNKAIEHDWFAETDPLARHYLRTEPDGPVRALGQIIVTMARAQAGQFDEALAQYKELMQGLGQADQEEFAASFSDSFASAAIVAARFSVAREVYTTLLARFKDSPNLRQKIEADLKRLDLVGKPAPAFATEDISGHPVRLADYRGKYLLVDFWATWCAPCIGELPNLQAAYQAYRDAGFEIIGVSLDESKAAIADFAKARKVPWPQIHNASSSADLVELFGISSIPATYLIDPQGTIRRMDLRGKALDQSLAPALKRTASSATAPRPSAARR